MIDIQKTIILMETRGVAKKADLIGMPDKNIQELEAHFDLSFPKAYWQFLQNFGRSAGYLSPWMAIYFDDLKKIRNQFEQLCTAQPQKIHLPEGSLIIANWESIFDYIVCDDDPDPAVYRIDLFNPVDTTSEYYTKTYSEYLTNMVESADTSSIPCDFFDDVDSLTTEDAL